MENSPFSGEFGKTRDELVLLGIPESEATIYLALLIIGESKAGEIATKLSMHGLDVYHDLKNLQSKDMVEGSISKPMKFKAVPLENVLTVLQNKNR